LIDGGISVTCIAKAPLVSNPVIAFFDHLWAEIATLYRREVNLFIKVPKVNDWLYNAGG